MTKNSIGADVGDKHTTRLETKLWPLCAMCIHTLNAHLCNTGARTCSHAESSRFSWNYPFSLRILFCHLPQLGAWDLGSDPWEQSGEPHEYLFLPSSLQYSSIRPGTISVYGAWCSKNRWHWEMKKKLQERLMCFTKKFRLQSQRERSVFPETNHSVSVTEQKPLSVYGSDTEDSVRNWCLRVFRKSWGAGCQGSWCWLGSCPESTEPLWYSSGWFSELATAPAVLTTSLWGSSNSLCCSCEQVFCKRSPGQPLTLTSDRAPGDRCCQ